MEEQLKIRKQWGLITPHTWSQEEDERTKQGAMKTARYTAKDLEKIEVPQPEAPKKHRYLKKGGGWSDD